MHSSLSQLFVHTLARRVLGTVAALAIALGLAQAPVASTTAGPEVDSSTQASSIALVRARARPTFSRRVMEISRSKRGTPYRYGASGPRAFDCSGFTSWVYRRAGRYIPRTSRAQAGATRRIRARDRRRGDLVFFHNRGRVYHVGIYAGRGQVWHSPRPGQRVHRARIWTRSHFYGRARR